MFNATSEAANATSTAPVSVSALPTDLAGLMAALLSFGALRDWLKLILFGGFFETCRRMWVNTYQKIQNSFYIHAAFEDNDSCYEWLMVWLSQQPQWEKTRNIAISTSSYGKTGILLEKAEGEEDNTTRVVCLPALSTSYNIWFGWHYVSLYKQQDENTDSYYKRSTLHISIVARNRSVLFDLLNEARKAYVAAQEKSTSIYVADTSNSWRRVSERSKRSLESIILEPGIKDLLVHDAKDFLGSKEWYHERGIPFRRGYLLYGVPGAGKTSIIHSLAGELNLDIYVVSLSRLGLDDAALGELINDLPERCIALMEDIDAAFSSSINRGDDDEDDEKKKKSQSQEQGPGATTSRVSLSGLLNALDGVGAQEGRILFATTNKYDALDPALVRPGRMDLHIEFKMASRYQARELFKRFYRPDHIHSRQSEKSTGAKSSSSSETAPDSGYASVQSSSSANSQDGEEGDNEAVQQFQPHSHAGSKIPLDVLDKLAHEFGEAVPERVFSMAALQGYLMTNKVWPLAAVEGAAAWIAEELEKKAKKEAKKAKAAEMKEAKAAEVKEEKVDADSAE
ncbi:P-loop containing nucleoside triphosphate hydrolase protein [Cylindrobasidium torrendii FP15055 ss-10]|uniref:p-loop containing nucleoside triphosphate hydrolase protein n=1 Tax=Cylindrobasidium torrendii FP15055 ss-10 TaxID=1314674 RepID=A0A0D7BFX1_9AGAR|nr:P-loop containing nucleoside triphosphate hydrolase protein [Cylindrobasidium torrendii FP15055 ss-10]